MFTVGAEVTVVWRCVEVRIQDGPPAAAAAAAAVAAPGKGLIPNPPTPPWARPPPGAAPKNIFPEGMISCAAVGTLGGTAGPPNPLILPWTCGMPPGAAVGTLGGTAGPPPGIITGRAAAGNPGGSPGGNAVGGRAAPDTPEGAYITEPPPRNEHPRAASLRRERSRSPSRGLSSASGKGGKP